MGRFSGVLACAATCALLVLSCRAPTQITVDLTTDFVCADLRGTALVVGELGQIETRSPAVVTTVCDDGPTGGNVGSVVLVPSGSESAQVAFRVVAGFGRPVEDCLTNVGVGCIVARRSLRYLPHTPLLVPVLLSSNCNGIACGETETCEEGQCVPAGVDPNQCAAQGGCPESPDGGSRDATLDAADDATLDAGDGAPLDAADDAGTVFHDITDPAYWTTFDLSTLNANAIGFRGGAFDGRYVYFVPWNNGTVNDGLLARYDTQGTFGASGAWLLFDMTTINTGAAGFTGTAFDGRYVYFTPHNNGAPDGLVLRYDTQAALTASGAWATFDTTTLNANAKGFSGATFDGRYVYFPPYINGNGSISARYDTQAPFGEIGSWTTFDLTTLNATEVGLQGAAFDGRYVYFVPNVTNGYDGVARYDTQASFATAGAWTLFDVATVNPTAENFWGAVFDGRYVYLVPNLNGVATRYDTQAAFGASGAWATLDIATVNAGAKGFVGGAFDGRYVYYVPFLAGGIVARYDTQASFATSAAWATFDTSTINAGATKFFGAAFDGRYMYFVPGQGSVAARFDAKTPPSLPPEYRGSFF